MLADGADTLLLIVRLKDSLCVFETKGDVEWLKLWVSIMLGVRVCVWEGRLRETVLIVGVAVEDFEALVRDTVAVVADCVIDEVLVQLRDVDSEHEPCDSLADVVCVNETLGLLVGVLLYESVGL